MASALIAVPFDSSFYLGPGGTSGGGSAACTPQRSSEQAIPSDETDHVEVGDYDCRGNDKRQADKMHDCFFLRGDSAPAADDLQQHEGDAASVQHRQRQDVYYL